jgi:hypothetical protein
VLGCCVCAGQQHQNYPSVMPLYVDRPEYARSVSNMACTRIGMSSLRHSACAHCIWHIKRGSAEHIACRAYRVCGVNAIELANGCGASLRGSREGITNGPQEHISWTLCADEYKQEDATRRQPSRGSRICSSASPLIGHPASRMISRAHGRSAGIGGLQC